MIFSRLTPPRIGRKTNDLGQCSPEAAVALSVIACPRPPDVKVHLNCQTGRHSLGTNETLEPGTAHNADTNRRLTGPPRHLVFARW